jgi:PTH1 family peptidyl-tRNA hydrolase
MSAIRLIAGLGNPGLRYERTRHNAGFLWVAEIGREHRFELKLEPRFHGQISHARIANHDVWVLKPQTYVNASGKAVCALARFYRIATEEILIVHDDLDLSPGAVKLKQGGGHAGHNGLKDIFAHLGGLDFWRLRIGVGHPGSRSDVTDYVLQAPQPEDARHIRSAILRSSETLPMIVAGEFSAAMLKLHTKPKQSLSES